MARHPDATLRIASTTASVVINLLVFGGMAYAGLMRTGSEAPKREFVMVEHIVRKGKPRNPKLLPRKTGPAPAPAPKPKAVHLGQPEEEPLEKKPKPPDDKLAAEKKRLIEEQRARDEAKREQKRLEAERRARSQQIASALESVEDEDAPGIPTGSAFGNTADPNAAARRGYSNRVRSMIQSRFRVPGLIPAEVRNRLKTTISFRIDRNGKLTGQPKITESSHNKLFDTAALRVIKQFGPGARHRIPLPASASLRREVLGGNLVVTLRGEVGG